ncbi:MAG: Ig-like domain-containing protein [Pirellulales bacterium]
MADGARLQVVDVADPRAPVLLGGCDVLDIALDVALSGTVAYVASFDAGLDIIDVTNPAAPARLGGRGGGQAQAVVVSGTNVYLADRSSGLVIIDVTNPAAPVPLSTPDPIGQAEDVAVCGTLAYVANGLAGLAILDIANPAAPVSLGEFHTASHARDVAVSGTLAYVVDYTGLQIIDVANPAAPRRLSGYASTTAYSVAVSETRVYVADGTAGLVILDVSDPAAPVRLGAYDTTGEAQGVAVSGSVAYVADGGAGLVTIDAANPAAPLRLGSYDTSGEALGVAVSGTVAYVADRNGGLVIVDVSNPSVPVRLGGVNTEAYGVTVDGMVAYVAGWTSGLRIIDVSQPALPTQLGKYADIYHSVRGVAVAGTAAYIANDDLGLQILDLRAPSSPPALDLDASSDTGVSSTDNVTSDTTLTFSVPLPVGSYFRVYRDGVQISNAYELATILPSYTTAVQPDGTYTYSLVATDAAGNVSGMSPAVTVTVDASIPLRPDLLAVSDSGVSSTDNLTHLDNRASENRLQFAVGNTVAGATVTLYADGRAIGSALAESTTTTITTNGTYDLVDGLHAITARQEVPGRLESSDSAALTLSIDTAPNLMNPRRTGRYDTNGYANGVAISGTVAYVADGSAGLVILDVTNPARPVRLGVLDTIGSAAAVVVRGTLAYIADTGGGLVLVDVTNPAAPVKLGAILTGDYAYGLSVSGTFAYVAAADAGLVIVDVANPAAPTLVARFDTSGFARDVAVSGTMAYVADDLAGVAIVDVTSPADPVQLATYDTGGTAYSVTIAGNLAFVADWDLGLVILDISDPAAPVRVGGYCASKRLDHVTVSGTLAYLAKYTDGLEVIDISDPTDLAAVGAITVGAANAYHWDVAVSGTLAYVAASTFGLEIIDVSLPTQPTAPDLQSASDTGISNTDNITGNTTPTFALAVPTEGYFRVYRDGTQISSDYGTGASYTTPLQLDGTYNYTVAAVDKAGNVSPQSPPLKVTVDTKNPTVQNVLVGSTRWTGEFLAELNAASSQNVGGYSVPVGTGSQLLPLAWGNIDQIKIVFNEGVMVDKDDLVLSGVNTPSYDLAGATFTYDPASFTATWTLASVIPADKLEIRLNADAAGFIQDPIARRLDGEWTNPASPADTGTDTYPSGNGTAGGDFVFRFRALPCDANQDGAVDIFDVAKLQVNYGQTSGMMPADGDFDGNGTVDIFDVALLQVAYGRTLEPPAPMPASAPVAELPPVAAQPGHSPTEPSKIAEPFGGRVSGPPTSGPRATFAERKATIPGAAEGDAQLFRFGFFSERDARGEKAECPRKSRISAFPKPALTLAVHHAAEDAAWESAVDRVLESERNPAANLTALS